jgi:DNA-binding CsgD family transcriptional regulator
MAAGDRLEHGRAAYLERRWLDAHGSLTAAEPLAAEDLERLATAAYMLGRDDEYVEALERAHRAYLSRGDELRAARCAFWIGINLGIRGELGRATGWAARARRLVERVGRDCTERGFLALQRMLEHEAAGDYDAALAAGADAMAVGERFADADLFALAAQDRGILLIKHGRVEEGLALLDEAMVTVTADELSPIVNGFVYCGVILGCQAAYEPRRAQEWTAALTRWCEQQPDMVSFTGTCLVHRAEIMQLHGAWRDALEEARRAHERCALASNAAAAAEAFYRQGEVHRLQGAFAAADVSYGNARRGGREPQPGVALLRLAQGRSAAAAAAIGRMLHETSDPSTRAALLPAAVEILLAIGDLDAAARASRELERIAERWAGGMMGAIAAYARGSVDLATGDARAALVALRRAWHAWRELEAPYEEARARVLLGQACAALGDLETAESELAAAREAFTRLGAAPDIARVDAVARPAPETHGLTTRELQVLRLVAVGNSNKQISAALVISEHTVARHLQNIFAKLGVSSRTAASAYAFAHDLVENHHAA